MTNCPFPPVDALALLLYSTPPTNQLTVHIQEDVANDAGVIRESVTLAFIGIGQYLCLTDGVYPMDDAAFWA